MKNILLLDAEMSWLACMREALVSRGYNVVTLPRPEMLNEYLHLQIPDLIVLHVRVLSNNAWRIVKLIKGSNNYRGIPVMLMRQGTLSVNELSVIKVNECTPGSFDMATMLIKVERLLFPERVIVNGTI